MSNMKSYERQMREQQDTLSKMQSTISIKSANAARLLERIQDYEKMVTKINIERNIFKRENRFFRAIINKLQSNQNEYYSFEKEEIYQKFGQLNCAPASTSLDENNYCIEKEPSSHGDFQGEYKFKHKLRVNICNSGCFRTSSTSTNANDTTTLPTDDDIFGPTCCSVHCNLSVDGGTSDQNLSANTELVGDYIKNCKCAGSGDVVNYSLNQTCCEPSEFPIRYTISDGLIDAINKTRCDHNDCSSSSLNSIHKSSNALPSKNDDSDQVFLKAVLLLPTFAAGQNHKCTKKDTASMSASATATAVRELQSHRWRAFYIFKIWKFSLNIFYVYMSLYTIYLDVGLLKNTQSLGRRPPWLLFFLPLS
ncbi:uncharacterized protein ACN2A1_001341 isoform 2-T2 [Glossina fuscipes fuscipes]